MVPEKLVREEQWCTWRREAEDYCEEVNSGMRNKMEEVRKSSEPITEGKIGPEWWTMRESLYRFLRRCTGYHLKRTVESIPEFERLVRPEVGASAGDAHVRVASCGGESGPPRTGSSSRRAPSLE